MKKRILTAVLSIAMVLSIAGCSTNTAAEATTTAAPAAGTTKAAEETTTAAPAADVTLLPDTDEVLTIVAWETNSDVQNMKKIFCEKTGVSEDKIVICPQGARGENARDRYEQYFTGDGDADILCLEADWILKYINDERYTAPLSAIGISEDQFGDAYVYSVVDVVRQHHTFTYGGYLWH